MGSQFGKTFHYLTLNANQIAYPQHYPANKSNRQHPTQQRKYNPLNYKNITDNQGWLPLKIDYTTYKPKSQNLDVEYDVVQRHLKALQKKQQILKQFKYHQDLERIDHYSNIDYATYQTSLEKIFAVHFFSSVSLSRIAVAQNYYHQFSRSLWKKCFFSYYLYTFPFFIAWTVFSQNSSPVNHQYFRTLPKDIRMYVGMAYDVDAFQHVNDLKYNFKYPERQDYLKTKKNVQQKNGQAKYNDALNYYKRKYGIIDPEPYLKNKPKKQQNKQVTTQ